MIYDLLNELNIEYEEIIHPPVFTAIDAQDIKKEIDGVGVKNLFLKDNKNNYYLYLIEDNKQADLKKLKEFLKTSHLSFCSKEELESILKLLSGSVSPLGIINDTTNKVTLIIDKNLENKKILCHPNINTKTISINYADLIKFTEHLSHKYIIY